MARLIPKTRKIRVKKSQVVRNDPEVFCVICGYTKEADLGNGFRPADGSTDSELKLAKICKNIVTCANMVSLLERKV